MKYFIADPEAEMGIRQLGKDRVTLLPDGSLEYRPKKGEPPRIVPSAEWATDWDKMVMPAYSCLKKEIEQLSARIETLKQTQADLVDISPRLQRLHRQLKLF